METQEKTVDDKRAIGPVTTATGAGAAGAYLICALIQMIWGVETSTEFQGALTVVIVVVAGWMIKPRIRGRRVAP